MSTQPPNFEKHVGYFIAVRDKIAAVKERHKEELKPLQETLEQLNSLMLGHLNAVGGDSVATPAGTVYRSDRKSATIADKSAFWTFVVTQGKFDLIDYKANAVAVADFINQSVEEARADPNVQPGPPPGVNYTVEHIVGVRRK